MRSRNCRQNLSPVNNRGQLDFHFQNDSITRLSVPTCHGSHPLLYCRCTSEWHIWCIPVHRAQHDCTVNDLDCHALTVNMYRLYNMNKHVWFSAAFLFCNSYIQSILYREWQLMTFDIDFFLKHTSYIICELFFTKLDQLVDIHTYTCGTFDSVSAWPNSKKEATSWTIFI